MFGLADIKEALEFTDGDLNWILVAYTLTFATILPAGGQLADRVGLRLTFLIGTFMLFWTNILISWTPDRNGLLAGRALAGVGAALTVGFSLSVHLSQIAFSPSQVRNWHLRHQPHIPTRQKSKCGTSNLRLMWTNWHGAGRHPWGTAHGVSSWLALNVLGELHSGRCCLCAGLLDHPKL